MRGCKTIHGKRRVTQEGRLSEGYKGAEHPVRRGGAKRTSHAHWEAYPLSRLATHALQICLKNKNNSEPLLSLSRARAHTLTITIHISLSISLSLKLSDNNTAQRSLRVCACARACIGRFPFFKHSSIGLSYLTIHSYIHILFII